VIGLTKTLSREWARYNVNVNCVAFGLIHTRLTQPVGEGAMTIEIKGRQLPVGVSNEMMQNLGLWIPMGRGGTPEEAAGAVFLMCLPEANYITGHVLAASGGY
jgi:3-oxoacyl-[acyl-carrier protein] reductase